MPPRARRPAGTELPSDPNEFAPNGSERTRQGRPIPENLPPGRLNQASDRPRNPKKDVSAEAEALREEVARPSRAELRAQALAERGLTPADDAAPEPGPLSARLHLTAQSEPDYEVVSPGAPAPGLISEETVNALAEALMLGLRLRLLGDPEGGSWEDWDELAQSALMMLAPEDPLSSLPPAARFLWGSTGLMRMPGEVTEAAQISDIITLGKEPE